MSTISFFDSRLTNVQALIDGLPQGTEAVLLDANQDGLQQIAAALAGRTDLDSIHIFSHGSAGMLQLGTTVLNGENLSDYQTTLAQIGSALSNNGDLLLYGCNVAQGEMGLTFVDQFAALTGADVAASADLTGAASLGGDWDLEVASGSVEATVFGISNYVELLDAPTPNNSPTADPVDLGVIAEDSGAYTFYATDLLANANDIDGDILTIKNIAVTTGGAGTLNDNGDGSYTFLPPANFNGEVQFSYGVTDNQFLSVSDSGLARLDSSSFSAISSAITFSEDGIASNNPSFNLDVTGLGQITVSFGGAFIGQKASGGNPQTLSDSTPSGPLALDPAAPITFVKTDGSNPTSPVLSGSPTFNGPISILFSQPIAAVGLDGGYFDALAGTTIQAYDSDGNILGTITNSAIGIEFYGLGAVQNDALIKGISFFITGNEQGGFAIDNLRIGAAGAYTVAATKIATTTATLEITSVNDLPTDITLDSNTIAENSTNGTLIGTVSTVDQDIDDTHTYTLLDNAGGRFVLDDKVLKVAKGSLLDYEQDPSHAISIKTTDAAGAFFIKPLTIQLNNVNEAPTDISLSNARIDENKQNGTVIGVLNTTDPDEADTYTYQLINNAGGRFAIVDNQLRVANGALLDFENNSKHVIRVRSTDSGGLSTEKDLTIAIANINDAPTVANPIANTSATEDTAFSLIVPANVFTDQDAGDTLTYSATLANGSPLPYWLDFKPSTRTFSGTPKNNAVGTLGLRVTATDSGNAQVNDDFNLTVINTNDAPTHIALSNYHIAENAANGTLVGTVSTDDVDIGDTHRYELIYDAGGRFALSGNSLIIADGSLLDYEKNHNHSITVKTTDAAGLSYTKSLTIIVDDVNEAPTGTSLSQTTIDKNSQNGSVIGILNAIDPDSEDTLSYKLVDNADGRFAIVDNQLQVLDKSLIDFGSNSDYVIRVRITDSGGLSVEKDLTITTDSTTGDLLVDKIAISPVAANLPVGASFDVSWTLTNQSKNAIDGSWHDKIYLDDPNTPELDRLLGDFTFNGGMLPGASQERIQTLTVPNLANGDYRVAVVTDANNQIKESTVGEANNTLVSEQTLSIVSPNLQVDPPTAPTSAFMGRPIQVQWTVSNTGTAATTTPVWYDDVWLSADTTLDVPIVQWLPGNDFYLGRVVNQTFLDKDQSYKNEMTVTLPSNITAGDYHILVRTDSDAQVNESKKENDNVNASSIVTIKPIPNDELSDPAVISVSAPEQALSGQRINLTYTIDNAGLAAIAASDNAEWTEEIFMSTDAVLDAGDKLLQTISRNLTADTLPKPNNATHFTTTESVALPLTDSGNFTFFVKVTPIDPVTNVSLDNDVVFDSVATVVHSIPPSDLQVSAINAPANALAGHPINVSYSVTNSGLSSTANTSWTDSLYLSLDKIWDASDIKVADIHHAGGLQPDDNYSNNTTLTLADDITGTYYLIAGSDSENEVSELDNANNFQTSDPITVKNRPADLTVDTVSIPQASQAGKSLYVAWQVSNQGTGNSTVTEWLDAIIASPDTIVGNGNDVLLAQFPHQGVLNIGDSYKRGELITLPKNLAGDYSIFAVTDYNHRVYEADKENNNSKAASSNITGENPNPDPTDPNPDPDPTNPEPTKLVVIPAKPSDLEVTMISAPLNGASGKDLTIDYIVKNNANKTNTSYWHDSIVLSPDTVLGNKDDLLVGTIEHYGTLDFNKDYHVSGTVTLPNNLQGTFNVFVKTDIYNRIWEGTEENNNTKQAGNTLTIALSPTPNLSISSLDAPNQAVSGQNLALTWTVANNGAATGQSYRTVFYLSRDQILDKDSDVYLGYAETARWLNTGATVSATAHLPIPIGLSGSYQVLAKVDSSNAIYERDGENDNVTVDKTPVAISLPPLTDLEAGIITVPQKGVPGQQISITYTVNNNIGVLDGNWQDSLYLSSDAVWDVNDPLFKQVDISKALKVGQSYTQTVSGDLPGLVAGDYHLIVRSDAHNVITESNEANNLTASLNSVTLDVESLALGTPDSGNLAAAHSVYYRLDVSAGETLKVAFDSAGTRGRTELFISYGEMPSRAAFDYRYSTADSPDQHIVIPNTQAGTYYILAYNAKGVASDYTISADTLQFGIEDLSIHQGSNKGQVTVRIDGAEFTTHTTAQLLGSDGVAYPAQQLLWKGGTELWATFDLQGMATGNYDVNVVDGTHTATLAKGFTVNSDGVGHIEYSLDTPPALLPGQEGSVRVHYQNTGETDVTAPLLTVSADALLKYPGDAVYGGTSMQVLGINNDGLAGILSPGAQGSFVLNFKPLSVNAHTSATINVSSVAPDQAMDWNAILDASKPDGIDPASWAKISANFLQQFGISASGLKSSTGLSQSTGGATTTDYQDVLAESATQLDVLEAGTNNVADLFSMAFLRATNNGALLRPEDIGVLGYGRTFDWDIKATQQKGGDVIVTIGGVQQRFVLQTDGSYSSDGTADLSEQNGAFTLHQQNGGQIAFNADGSFNAIIDSNGNTLHATYNAVGQLSQVTGDFGDSQSFTYNPQGRLSSITDQDGHITDFTYTANAEYLTGITTANGTVKYAYVGTGSTKQVSAITLPDGTVQHFAYDSQGRLVKESVNTDQQVTTYEYVGINEVLVKDGQGETMHLWLNERGQIAQVENTLGKVTQLHYDVNGNLTETVNPDGTISRLTYSADNAPLSVQDALGNTVKFAYHEQNGQLANVTDQRGNPINYDYDAHGNLSRITYADGSNEQYSYNDNGNLTVVSNRSGDSIGYTYDAKGQLVQKNYADGSTANFGYDAHGNLTQASDADSSMHYEYDSYDRLIKTTDADGRWLSYGYDAIGRKILMSDSAGHTTHYSYNGLGQLARLSDADDNTIASYQYDNDGRLSRGDNGNGTYTTYEYDAANQLTHLINYQSDGTVNSRFDYTYNDMGQRTGMTTLDGTTGYSYDAIGQLTGVTLPDGRHIDYRYDAAGNRISVDDDGVATHYSTNALNQYGTVGEATYSYDDNGNLVGKTEGGVITSYGYDVENRLVKVTTPSDTWQYEYDALGNRVASVHNGERVEYQLDPTGLVNVVGEYDGTGQLLNYFTHGIGLESRADQNGSNYYDFDALGSTAGLTNATGGYVDRYSYLPFGENLTTSEAVANPFEYVGQWGVMDAGNGLDFMRARFYDEGDGRFVSTDPIGVNGSLNLYEYAKNNPLSFIDESGYVEQRINTDLTPQQRNERLDFLKSSERIQGTNPTIDNYNPTWGPNTGYLRNFDDRDITSNYGDIDFDWALTLLAASNKSYGLLPPSFLYVPGKLYWGFKNGDLLTKLKTLNNPAEVQAQAFADDVYFRSFFSSSALRNALEHWGIHAKGTVPILAPGDPNDILNPKGFGADHWLPAKNAIPYTIRYENQATATAPAQQVTITEKLDKQLDIGSFRLGDFGWGDLTIQVPDNAAFYTDRLDLTATQGFFVDVIAGIDATKGEVFWTFTTIDPKTGEIPTDPRIGFLPTNVEKGSGEGFVNYSIKPSATAAPGTVIDAQATIIFTSQEPIDTPQVFNTLDTKLPTSQITVSNAKAAQQTVDSTQFLVQWSGKDIGSGLADYSIYVSDNGGDYQLWLDKTTLLEATYTGKKGHHYDFYSLATDNAGNREAAPAQTDLAVKVTHNAALTDIVSPTITSIVPPNTGVYRVGQALRIQLLFSEKVFVDIGGSVPALPLIIGTANGTADYLSGSGTHKLIFSHTVQAGELDADGISFGDSLVLNNSIIRDQTGNPIADLALTPNTSTTAIVDDSATGYLLITGTGANAIRGGLGNDTLDGGADADALKGGLGDDSYIVDNSADVVTEDVNAGTDTVNSSIDYTLGANLEKLNLTGTAAINGTGNELNNVLTGNAKANVLNGGTGADTLKGGLGNDNYWLDNSADVVIETSALAAGIDTVHSPIDYRLGAHLENLTLTGTAAINGTGNALDNVLTGNAKANSLNGGAGADTLKGGLGNDSYRVDNSADVVKETSTLAHEIDRVYSLINYTLGANLENLILIGTAAINGSGNALDNVVTGNVQANILNGGAGADTLKGGLGNDSYWVGSRADVVTETSTLATEIDSVHSPISYTLGANLENLTLTGTAAINGTGNALNNVLTGNAKANILSGGAGADTLEGGLGKDSYRVDNSADVVTETSDLVAEIDTVYSSVSYKLGKNIENLTLTGTADINATGNMLNNVLTGNTGVNKLKGGTGNDNYVVDNIGDVVTETSTLATEIDTVYSSVSYKLGANIENLTLTGTDNINATGNALNNVITGNAGANKLKGGAGNDNYVVDNIGDEVIETSALASQTDTVYSSVSYRLRANVENITLTGTADINATGNTLNNVITGNTGANVLKGGAGNDNYVVDNAGDEVIEISALTTEIDAVFSSVSYILKDNIENLGLTGTTAIDATGNDLNNLLTGNAAENILTGGEGNDNLNGGAGNDTLIGGLDKDNLTGDGGSDNFKFTRINETGITETTCDVITDFNASQGDKIDLSAIDANTAMAGNNAFTIPTIGGAFSGSFANPGDLYFDEVNQTLYGNNDADAEADFSILISGVIIVSAMDFVL